MLSRAWLQLGLGWDVWVWIVVGHTVASLHGLGQSRSLPCFSLSSKLIHYAASGVTCILSFHQKVSFFSFFFPENLAQKNSRKSWDFCINCIVLQCMVNWMHPGSIWPINKIACEVLQRIKPVGVMAYSYCSWFITESRVCPRCTQFTLRAFEKILMLFRV